VSELTVAAELDQLGESDQAVLAGGDDRHLDVASGHEPLPPGSCV